MQSSARLSLALLLHNQNHAFDTSPKKPSTSVALTNHIPSPKKKYPAPIHLQGHNPHDPPSSSLVAATLVLRLVFSFDLTIRTHKQAFLPQDARETLGNYGQNATARQRRSRRIGEAKGDEERKGVYTRTRLKHHEIVLLWNRIPQEIRRTSPMKPTRYKRHHMCRRPEEV